MSHNAHLYSLHAPSGTGQIGKKGSDFQFSCHSNSVWERHFGSLLHFQEIHGHCNVPTIAKGEFRSLGRWVSSQRKEYKNFYQNGNEVNGDGVAREEFSIRCQRLKDIGFNFVGSKGRPRKLK